MHRSILCFLAGLLSVLLIGQPTLLAQSVASPPLGDRSGVANVEIPTRSTERRGIWITNIDSDVMFKPDKLKGAIDNLAKLNFNTLYPVAWNFGYTFYPSAVAKKVTGILQAPGLKQDSLAELVTQAHAKKMAVMPWFEFGFMAPETSELALAHPDWLTNKQNFDPVWVEGVEPRVWLNPFLPAVQQFMTDLVLETIDRYDIDGIQFDDHFGLPNDFGYDDYTIALYRQEHNGKAPPKNIEDPQWIKWRADKITDYTARLVSAIKAKKPSVQFSLSPNPYDFAYHHSLQDWKTWQERGLLDELIVQVYVSDINRFKNHLQRPEIQAAAKNIPVSIGVLSGLRNKKVPFQRIRDQVEAVRKSGLAGVSFFFYETLWNISYEPSPTRQRSFQQLFPQPADLPMPPRLGV